MIEESLAEVRVERRVELAKRGLRRQLDDERAARERRLADGAGELAPAQRAVGERNAPAGAGDPDALRSQLEGAPCERGFRADRPERRERAEVGAGALALRPCAVPVGTNASAACIASRSPAIAMSAARRRARSSVGTCTSTDGAVPSGFARSVPVAAGRSSPSCRARREAASPTPSRLASRVVRTDPSASVRGAARRRQLGSVRGGRRAHALAAVGRRVQGGIDRAVGDLDLALRAAICSTAGRRRPDVCNVAVAASDSGTILKLALAAPNRSACRVPWR